MTEVLDKVIEAYRRASFLAGLNGDFAALRQNRAASKDQSSRIRGHWTSRSPMGLRNNFR